MQVSAGRLTAARSTSSGSDSARAKLVSALPQQERSERNRPPCSVDPSLPSSESPTSPGISSSASTVAAAGDLAALLCRKKRQHGQLKRSRGASHAFFCAGVCFDLGASSSEIGTSAGMSSSEAVTGVAAALFFVLPPLPSSAKRPLQSKGRKDARLLLRRLGQRLGLLIVVVRDRHERGHVVFGGCDERSFGLRSRRGGAFVRAELRKSGPGLGRLRRGLGGAR